jgi:hypothetical protein
MSMESQGGMILSGENQRTRKEPVPVPLDHTNPTWTDKGICCERLATNCLRHGMAMISIVIYNNVKLTVM